jgi:ABC-type glycerol-3-phosphate transport system substrate-binding protein
MKKIIKVFGLMLIICLFVSGCGKDNNGENGEGSTSKENAQKQVEGKLSATEVGFFNGEFKEKTVVLKIENGNKKPVYVNVSFEMYDEAGTMLYNKEVYVRVGANNSAYAVAIQDAEEPTFASYKYTLKNMDETLEDYEKIYNGIKYTYNDNGRHVTVTYTNDGKRTTTVYGLVMYYKNNNLVAVVEATEYNLMPTSVRDVEVRYPIETVTKKISFDRFEVVLNEVSTEL